MACQIETVAYPAWWGSASTVRIRSTNAGSTAVEYTGTKDDVEFLPEGVSFPSRMTPWSYVLHVELVS